MKSKLRAVFFDAGNTLIYPRLERLVERLAVHGYTASEADFFAAERAGKQKLDEWLWPQIRACKLPRTTDDRYWREYLRALAERINGAESVRETFMRAVADGFRDMTLWSRVYPDTAPLLSALRGRGCTLGVISNSNDAIDEQLARVGLAGHFDTIIVSGDIGVEKAHPEIFQIALSRAGVTAEEAVFIGDTYATDVGGAQFAGLAGVLIDRVGAYPDAQCPRITSLGELEKVLDVLAAT